jgi:hypothetical protein
MGRRPRLDKNTQLGWFLLAVRDHPWATPSLIQADSGLSPQAIKRVAQPLALKHGLVERGDIRGESRAARRFGLMPEGAALLGQRLPRSVMRDACLRALHLDSARRLLAEWVWYPGTIWSCSPFTVSAKYLRPTGRRSRGEWKAEPGEYGDGAYHSLRFDGLACVSFGQKQYLNVAIWVDPGHIALDGFYHQFRSAYAWSRRPEFTGHVRTLPLLVVLAANEERRQRLLRVWDDARPDGEHPHYFRITTLKSLECPDPKRPWWDERGQPQTGVWGRVVPFEHPSLPPTNAENGWWGEMATSLRPFTEWPTPLILKRKQASVLEWAEKAKTSAARMVRDHRAVGLRGRELLEQIGRYPLITTRELATVLGRTRKAVADGLRELIDIGLIHHPNIAEAGYVMTSWGLELLAGQAGFSRAEYAKLRHWPVRTEGRVVHYAVEGLLACRAHTRLVLDFLVGMRCYGEGVHWRLLTWDHVQCLIEFPFQPTPEKPPKRRSSQPARSEPPRVSPDAMGQVRVFSPTVKQYTDTAFWLEVDRSTEKGQALWGKLDRYYRIQNVNVKVRSWPRLLIVVERDDEARLQALRRRLIWLNGHYKLQLDVRLTRADLLDDDGGKLNPTKKVWRMVESSEFGYAFDRPVSQ